MFDLLIIFSHLSRTSTHYSPVTCYLSSLCLVTHRAFTEVLHLSRSTAIVLVSSHELHPGCFRPSSTDLLHVVMGLSLLLFPSGAQLIAMLQSLLRSCPTLFHNWIIDMIMGPNFVCDNHLGSSLSFSICACS